MGARIDDHFMTAEYDGPVIATARYSAHAADGGRGAQARAAGGAAAREKPSGLVGLVSRLRA
jgi:hypothetical protein